MTGYELAKQFDASVGHLWHAPHSQIYPELRRMEEAGLIEATPVPRGPHAVKRSYAITAAGRAEVSRWVAEVTPGPRPREADYVRASYLEFTTPDEARAVFRALHDRHADDAEIYAAHAAEIEARSTPLMRDRIAGTDAADQEAIVAYKVHVYRGLAARAAAEARWAADGIALVDRLVAAGAPRNPGGEGLPAGPEAHDAEGPVAVAGD
jgi:DNA-binding PadR family transcriptional regulator